MGKNAIRAIKPFVRRTMDGLWPMDVVTVDGHIFKAYVRHPATGARFRPEVTTEFFLSDYAIPHFDYRPHQCAGQPVAAYRSSFSPSI